MMMRASLLGLLVLGHAFDLKKFVEDLDIGSLKVFDHLHPVIKPFLAPYIEVEGPPVLASEGVENTPVVFMHGMGDAGHNRGMKSVCETVTKKYPGTYSKCLNVANGNKSIMKVMDDQLLELVDAIRADPKLAKGFHAVGLSQGSVLLKAYIVRYNDPPVKTFVSVCGPLEGVGTCPKNAMAFACPFWKKYSYSAPIAFADYWKDHTNKTAYLEQSRFLADIGNERAAKNATYKANYMSLSKLVLVMAEQDTMVVPKESEQHGFWAWGGSNRQHEVVEMTKYDGYVGDYLGLQTMDKAGKVDRWSFEGDHLRFNNSFWEQNILPYFAPKNTVKTA